MDFERLINEGRYKEVIDYFRKNTPQSAKEFLSFGIALFYFGLLEESAKILETGLSLFPNDTELLINLAEVYFQKEEYEKAFEKAKKCLELGIEDPYLFDIVATYYKNLNQEKLAQAFAQKAHDILLKNQDSESAEQIKIKYALTPRKKKKMLIIGSCANYGDSFVKFVEEGWELFVIKTNTWRTFVSNYEAFVEIGAKLIKEEDIDDFIKDELKNIDIIFRTGFFYGGDDTTRTTRFYDIDHFNILYKLTSVVKQKNFKAKTVIAFDGDTFVHEPFWAEWLSKRLIYVDWILFDTENLRKYFLKHVKLSPNTKTKVMLVEVPLKREVRINLYDSYIKYVITMGRDIPAYIPVPGVLIKKMDTPLAIGGGGGYVKRLKERRIFEEVYGNIAFGLGYFHDFYVSEYSFEEILDKSLENLTTTMRFSNYLPNTYPYVNLPGKIITYLQFGIIPIVPLNGNDFYENLLKNEMAFGLEKEQDYFEPISIPDNKISNMRKNIIENTHLFTFDKFFDFVNSEVMESGSDG